MPKAKPSNTAKSFMEPIPLKDVLPINQGLTSATEHTMVSILGSPKLPLTTDCQNNRASELVLENRVTEKISDLFRLTGMKQAIADIKAILTDTFKEVPDLESVLTTEGMLCVRRRKPTTGPASKAISNHSWGTAVDFKIVGFDAPGNTGKTIPKFVKILLPRFNKMGWYSGIAFHDAMHFEVSEEKIRKWSKDGKL